MTTHDDFQKVVISDKMQETKIIFCFPNKKLSQKQKNNDEFRKVVISDKMQEKKNFCPPKKRAKPKTKKITTTFRKSLFIIKSTK